MVNPFREHLPASFERFVRGELLRDLRQRVDQALTVALVEMAHQRVTSV
jgi:hypothetical protein